MSQTITITINGKPYECEKGEILLEVARRNGLYIPSLCYHEGLAELGACRVCIVEVIERGRSKVVVSCVYPVEREIEVLTASPRIREERGVILALLAQLAPNSEEIRTLARQIGVELPLLAPSPNGDKCILCGRCTTACEQLGAGAIAKVNRGVLKEIATPYHAPAVACIGCGSCAHVCPTGAIAYEQGATSFTIWDKTFELISCSECGTPFITAEQYDWQQRRKEEPTPPVCDSCEKKATARRFRDTSVRYDLSHL